MSWPGWESFNPEAREQKPAKPQKYHAKPVTVDGIRFASKREAHRWGQLQMAQRAGAIRNLERQVPILLHAPGGALVGRYVADFRFTDVATGKVVLEDAKGVRLPIYRWKARHVLAEYGIEIQEV